MKTRKNRLPPFVPLLVDMLDAPATKALSHGAFRLYVALKRQYNPDLSDRRNGRVYLSQRRAHQEIRSKREQIARWYRELEYYGFIVMTAPGCLGPNGRGKAARWRLTELGYMNDLPTKDFLRWKGAKFCDQKNQKPGPEIGATLAPQTGPLLAPKSGPPQAKSGPEDGAKGKAESGPENGSITKSYHCVGAQSLPRPRGKGRSSDDQGGPSAPGATVMRTDLRSLSLTKAIRCAVREARLSYEFVPNSYTASAFNAALGVEQGCCGNEVFFSDGPMARLHRECETPYRRVLDEATGPRRAHRRRLNRARPDAEQLGRKLMTIELMGMKPTTKRGEKFGRNIHGWGELARYSTIVAPDICAPIKYWLDDSIHEGLDAAGAVALADALQTEIDAGRTAAYAALVHPEDTPQTGPDVLFEPPESPHPFSRTSPPSSPSCAEIW